MPGPYAAQRFLCNAEIRGDHAQRHPVEQGRGGIDQLLVALRGRGKMEIIKALLQLYDTIGQQQAAEPLYIVVAFVEGFKIPVRNGPQHGRLEQFYAAHIRLVRDKTDDGNGDGIFRAQPVGHVLAIFQVPRSGEPLLNKIKILADAARAQQVMAPGQFHSLKDSGKRFSTLFGEGSKLGYKDEKWLHLRDKNKEVMGAGYLIKYIFAPVEMAVFPLKTG